MTEHDKARKRRNNKAYYLRHKAKVLLSHRVYRQTPAGKKLAYEAQRRQWENHPDRVLARVMVYEALRAGKLIKQACGCGSLDVQAHHADYSKPLSVTWMCRPCHALIEAITKM